MEKFLTWMFAIDVTVSMMADKVPRIGQEENHYEESIQGVYGLVSIPVPPTKVRSAWEVPNPRD